MSEMRRLSRNRDTDRIVAVVTIRAGKRHAARQKLHARLHALHNRLTGSFAAHRSSVRSARSRFLRYGPAVIGPISNESFVSSRAMSAAPRAFQTFRSAISISLVTDPWPDTPAAGR